MKNLEASLGLRVVRNRWWSIVATVTIVAAIDSGLRFLNFNMDNRVFFSEGNPQLVALENPKNTYVKTCDVAFTAERVSGDSRPDSIYRRAGQLAWTGILPPEFLETRQLTAYEMMDSERDELTTDTRLPTDMPTASIKLAAVVAVNNLADTKRYIEAVNRPGAAPAEMHLANEMAKVIPNRAREFVDEAIAEFTAETAAENRICSSIPGETKCPD